MEDYEAILESAGYSCNGDVWEKTADGVTLKVTPRGGEFEIRGKAESRSGNMKKTQEMTFVISGWENLREADISMRAAFSETPLADSLNKIAGDELFDRVSAAGIGCWKGHSIGGR